MHHIGYVRVESSAFSHSYVLVQSFEFNEKWIATKKMTKVTLWFHHFLFACLKAISIVQRELSDSRIYKLNEKGLSRLTAPDKMNDSRIETFSSSIKLLVLRQRH